MAVTLGLARFFVEFSQDARHAFVSGIAAAADPTLVDGPNWDAAHLVPDIQSGLNPGFTTEDAIAPGSIEFFAAGALGINRWLQRLAQTVQLRIQAFVTDASVGTSLGLEYTLDLTGLTGWTTMGVSASVAATGLVVSAWGNVPAPAKAAGGVLLRWVLTA